MRYLSHIVVAAALAGATVGCAERPYYGPSYAYASSPRYAYVSSYPSGYYYRSGYYSRTSYNDYYRDYNGIHAPDERTGP